MSVYLLSVMLLLGSGTTSEEIEVKTPTGTLVGTLDLPDSPAPWPVVFIHPGSGPTDRDGNNPQMKNNSLKMLGEGLAQKGYACLRIDKRAIAGSAKAYTKEDDLRVQTYGDDILAWTELLRKDQRFSKIAFIGHSEGSMLGAMVANEAKFDAFVSLCGPGRKAGDILREQLNKNLPEDLNAESVKIIAELEAGREFTADMPKTLKSLFRQSVQPYLISWFKMDPVQDVKDMKCPVLVVSGTTDIQVMEADAKALSTAKKDVDSVRIEHMNHVLKELKSLDKLPQTMTYIDPKKELHPELLPAIGKFLDNHLRAK